MAIKEITLNGPGQVRVRVIKQDATEAATVFMRSVPTGFSSPFGLRFRIKQVTTSGKSSYWAYSRQISIPFVLGGTARFRMRAVSSTGLMSEWRYASIQTASDPGEPGGRILEAFVSGIFDLLIDAFVDKLHLEARRQDQLAISPSDSGSTFQAMQLWVERLGLDRMDALLEASRLKLHESFKENLEDFLAVAYQGLHTFKIRPDTHTDDPVDQFTRAILYRFMEEVASDFALSDQVWAELDDASKAALDERSRDLFAGDFAAAWTGYIASDQLVQKAIDALGVITSSLFSEKLPLAAYELVATTQTIKRAFEDAFRAGLSQEHIWEARPYLLDRVLFPFFETDFRWSTTFDLSTSIVKPHDQIWAVTDEPRAYLQEHMGDRMGDLLEIEDTVLLKEQASFAPTGLAWHTYLWAFREVFEGLVAWRVSLHQKLTQARESFSEGLPMGMGIAMGKTALPGISDETHLTSGPDRIPEFALKRSELFDWSAFQLDDSELNAVFGEQIGASDSAFIMGFFIMGVTPMGVVTYA